MYYCYPLEKAKERLGSLLAAKSEEVSRKRAEIQAEGERPRKEQTTETVLEFKRRAEEQKLESERRAREDKLKQEKKEERLAQLRLQFQKETQEDQEMVEEVQNRYKEFKRETQALKEERDRRSGSWEEEYKGRRPAAWGAQDPKAEYEAVERFKVQELEEIKELERRIQIREEEHGRCRPTGKLYSNKKRPRTSKMVIFTKRQIRNRGVRPPLMRRWGNRKGPNL
jgi:hypothetical protein